MCELFLIITHKKIMGNPFGAPIIKGIIEILEKLPVRNVQNYSLKYAQISPHQFGYVSSLFIILEKTFPNVFSTTTIDI